MQHVAQASTHDCVSVSFLFANSTFAFELFVCVAFCSTVHFLFSSSRQIQNSGRQQDNKSLAFDDYDFRIYYICAHHIYVMSMWMLCKTEMREISSKRAR